MVQRPLPGLLASLAGVEIEDWTTLPDDQTRAAKWIGASGGSGGAGGAGASGGDSILFDTFVERIKTRGAQICAAWDTEDTLLHNDAGGAPAVTVRKVGKGWVYYLGGYCPRATVARLIAECNRVTGLRPVVEAPGDVEAIVRRAGPRRWTFLLNHADTERQVEGVWGMELLTGAPVDRTLTLPAYGVAVIACR